MCVESFSEMHGAHVCRHCVLQNKEPDMLVCYPELESPVHYGPRPSLAYCQQAFHRFAVNTVHYRYGFELTWETFGLYPMSFRTNGLPLIRVLSISNYTEIGIFINWHMGCRPGHQASSGLHGVILDCVEPTQ